MLDLEGPLSGQQSPTAQRARFDDSPDLSLGALQGVPLTLQLAAATRVGSFGLQGGLVALLGGLAPDGEVAAQRAVASASPPARCRL